MGPESVACEPLAGGSLIELRQSTDSRYAWRIVVVAEANTEDALRKAKELAIQFDSELFEDLRARRKQWRERHRAER